MAGNPVVFEEESASAEENSNSDERVAIWGKEKLFLKN